MKRRRITLEQEVRADIIIEIDSQTKAIQILKDRKQAQFWAELPKGVHELKTTLIIK